MALQGLDRAGAPDAAKAKAMLDEIRGVWWNVYIGGPRRNPAAASWTPELVKDYQAKGINRFLLTYVGRQVLPDRKPPIDDRPLLTAAQGERDGEEACQLAGRFGFGAGAPVCLDVERSTFDASRNGSLDYACSWCKKVRARGFRPGVYANRAPVEALVGRANGPDWVWVCSFVRHDVDPAADPHRIPRLSDNVFSMPGQRAWQYGAAFDGKPARVGELDVDINVADSECLTGHGPGLVPGGLSPADAQNILNRMEQIFAALRDGTATNMNSLANIRSHVVGMEADVKAVRNDVDALRSAHPHA
jgi:Domain of unknown function (DUF1906)